MKFPKRAGGIVVLLVWLCPVIALASSETENRLQQGMEALTEQRFAVALEQFTAAVQADPTNAKAIFFRGATLNRLGRQQQARPILEHAQALGAQHPDLTFELGWSLLATGQLEEAIRQLQQYEQAYPGRGQTSEFLGRAYLGLSQHDNAKTKLEEALRRDPTLASTVHLYLAMLAEQQGNTEEAVRNLQSLFTQGRESRLGRTLAQSLPGTPGTPGAGSLQKPWRIHLNVSGGFNDNVIALGDGVALPTNISNQSSPFAQTGLTGTYNHRLSAVSSLTATYAFTSLVYSDISGFDLSDHYMALTYRTRLWNRVVAFLTASDQYTRVGGSRFRNEFALRPAIGFQVTEALAVEGAYRYAASNYFANVPAVLNRDADVHHLSISGSYRLPRTQAVFGLSGFHIINDADGASYESDALGLQLSLVSPLGWDVTGELSYSHTDEDFDNPNVFSVSGAKREDNLDRLTIRVSRPVIGPMSAFVLFTHTRNDSNIAVFNYEQNVVSGGLTGEF